MKSRWTRDYPPVELDAAAVGVLMAPAFRRADVIGIELIAGGLTNTNLKVVLAGRATPVLLRVYQREAAVARKEVVIMARLAGTVPVPRCLYFCERGPSGHAYAIMEWIAGERLDVAWDTSDPATRQRLGRAVGYALAGIHGHLFDRAGFLTPDLRIATAIDMGRSGLLAYLQERIVMGPGAGRLGAELACALWSFAERDGELLDSWLDPPSLVHADFNGPNILVRPNPDGGLEVAAVVDWEYALSASPALDFGNLLRPPLGHNANLVAAVADGYRSRGGALPAEWQRVARVADLFAWADILGRPGIDAVVVADARRVIHDIITCGAAC